MIDARDAVALVAVRQLAAREPRLRMALAVGDYPLVQAGDRVELDAPLVLRLRHPGVAESPLRGSPVPGPGLAFEAGEVLAGSGRRTTRFDAPGRVLYRTPSGRLRAVVGRHRDTVLAPASGVVDSVGPTTLDLRADGIGLPAALAAGEPAHGPLVIAVEGPAAELQARQIDVRGSGAVLIGGARVDVETITRARAMGVRGIVVGGMVGKDLRDMAASAARQQAALHASPPFALVVLEGCGKRPIADLHWQILTAAAGRDVALSVDPPGVLLDAAQAVPTPEPDLVHVVAGEALGRHGRLVEAVGPRRRPGGLYQPCARVALEPGPGGEPPELVELPLADLERYVVGS